MDAVHDGNGLVSPEFQFLAAQKAAGNSVPYSVNIIYIKPSPPAADNRTTVRVAVWMLCIGLMVLAGIIANRSSELGLDSLSEFEASSIAGGILSVALIIFVARETTLFAEGRNINAMTDVHEKLTNKISDYFDTTIAKNENDKKILKEKCNWKIPGGQLAPDSHAHLYVTLLLNELVKGEDKRVVKTQFTFRGSTNEVYFVRLHQEIIGPLESLPEGIFDGIKPIPVNHQLSA